MRWRVGLFGTLGLFATSVGITLLVSPSSLPEMELLGATLARIGGSDSTVPVALASLVATLYLVVAASGWPGSDPGDRSDARRRLDRAATHPPEAVTSDREARVAARVESDIRTAVEAGGQPYDDLRATIRRTAIAAYAEADDVDRDVARSRIERGEWTDDPVARAVLADSDGPALPLGSRLRVWLTPVRERQRRIDRTTEAIDRLLGDSRGPHG